MPAFEFKEMGAAKDCHTLRLACTCRDLSHHLDITIDNDPAKDNYGDLTSIEVNTAEHAAFHWFGKEKWRAIWRILINKPVCLGGIMVSRDDLKMIVKFIRRHTK